MIDVDQICRNVQEEINKRNSTSMITFTFSECEGCKERDKEISELKARIKSLQEEVDLEYGDNQSGERVIVLGIKKEKKI